MRSATIVGIVILSVSNITGYVLNNIYNAEEIGLVSTNNKDSESALLDAIYAPIPSGNLVATDTINLPDIHETGQGWTCTGLAYDAKTDSFLIGDIGKEHPTSAGFASQIVRIQPDFETIVETIPLYTEFPNMQDIQGITIDTSDDTIWLCSIAENKVRNIDKNGNSIKSFNLTGANGIAYSRKDNCFWILATNTNEILMVSKNGTVQERYSFAFNEIVDQCFLDEGRGILYITAGTNYSGRNNIYCFNISTHEQYIACTADVSSIEGIWLGKTDKMIIVNDGYYHSAAVPYNQVNIYTIDGTKR